MRLLNRIIKGILWRSGLWNTFYQLFWKPTSIEAYSTIIYQNEVNDIGNFNANFLWSELARNSYYNQNQQWRIQKEFIYQINQTSVIEPSQGLILLHKNKLVEASRIHNYIFPKIRLWFTLKYRSKIDVEEAFYFDGYIGESYYHFFSDTMACFYLYKNILNKPSVPLIIHYKTYQTKHFQFILTNTDLCKYKILVVKDHPIRVKKLYVSKAAFSIEYWESISQKLLNSDLNKPLKKLFLTRSSNVGRNISNLKEVTDLVKELGFEIVDTEFLSMEEQSKLLKETKILVGIHGAGLTNILFAQKGKFTLLEINPIIKGEKFLRPHYYWLSQCLGHKYQCLEGGILNKNQKFSINRERLKNYIIQLSQAS